MLISLEPTLERLDKALLTHLSDLSRVAVQRLIEEGFVLHNGVALTMPSLKVKQALELEVTFPEVKPAEPMGQNIPLQILFEDEDLVVLEKPPFLVVHPASGHETGTLVNALIHHCGETLSGVGGVKRPGIVHRLDKDTSGVMVVAKNDMAHRHLSSQFADHGRTGVLKRAYKAFVWGEAPFSKTIDLPLDRDPKIREKIAVRQSGREAITHIKRLESFTHASLVECVLETGRTHQIRVHLSHIGFPLLGDFTYGSSHKSKISKLGEKAQATLSALNRQALHAYLLQFEHPRTGETMRFESELPHDLKQLYENLKLDS